MKQTILLLLFAPLMALATDNLYLVVDLSAGATATTYPISYLSDVPDGGWTGEYKTTKLVLRRVSPGTCVVTVDKPYYVGVFEVTQKQYELIMGETPFYSYTYIQGDTNPVAGASYDMIRGKDSGAQYPKSLSVDEDSFFGKMRKRTGLKFDLPTTAQWEYACRAGATTKYSYGDEYNNEYMWWQFNSGKTAHEVGTRKPNLFGIYDMHGNASEWCLGCIVCGGSWWAGDCDSSSRWSEYSNYEGGVGFRVAWIEKEYMPVSYHFDAADISEDGYSVHLNKGGSAFKVTVVGAGEIKFLASGQYDGFYYIVRDEAKGTQLSSAYIRGANNECSIAFSDANTHSITWYTYSAPWYTEYDGDVHWVKWNGVKIKFQAKITFDANGGECEEISRKVLTDRAIGALPQASRIGYRFMGWGTNEVDVSVSADAIMTEDATLYAIWKAGTYTVTFDANGGVGEMPAQTFIYDTAQALSGCAFAKDQYLFCGWATSVVGNVVYYDCECVSNLTVTTDATVPLFAQWAKSSEITTWKIPRTVTNINVATFSGCGKLTAFEVSEDNPTYASVGGLLYDKARTTLLCVPSGLTEVTIPKETVRIADGAFANCSNLASVTVLGTPPSKMDNVFVGTPSSLVVHADATQAGWIQWGGRPLAFDVGTSGGSSSIGINLTVTNVVVHYIQTSEQSPMTAPVSQDVGIVNVMTEVKGGNVAIPDSWTDNYPTFVERFGSDFSTALTKQTGKFDAGGKPMMVWQDFVAGTDPTDEDSVFKASVTMVDGVPVVSYTPKLSDEEKTKRKYTTLGKVKLQDADWVEVPSGHEADYNFFKVTVEMK